jgi:hypothetical protein
MIFYVRRCGMDKKLFVTLIVLGVFAVIMVGCTSVPEVKRVKMIGDGKYDVVVDRDYMEDPQKLEYAFNSFVKEKGGDSYDVEQYGSNDFYVTIPGSTMVQDLPEIRHFDAGKTAGLVLGLAGPPVAISLIILMLGILFPPVEQRATI